MVENISELKKGLIRELNWIKPKKGTQSYYPTLMIDLTNTLHKFLYMNVFITEKIIYIDQLIV